MTSSSSAFLQLPHEILLRVFEYSPPASLKQIRGTCQTLKALADPILWHTIYLYPHMDRFRQILDLSILPSVRCHVHQIVYDLRWAPLADAIISRLLSVYSVRVTDEEKAMVLERVRRAKRGTLEPGRDDDIELLFLQDILRNLKLLQSIKIYENNAEANMADSVDLDSLPSYYQQLRQETCGALCDTDLDPGQYCLRGSTRSTKRVLVAANSLGNRIKDFEVYNAHWEHVTAFERDGKHLDLLRDFIGGLRSLQLHAKFDGHLTPNFLMKNLGIVLNLATNLESLDLSWGVTRECDPFSDDGDWDSDDGDDPSSAAHSVLEIMDSAAEDGMSRWGTGLHRLALSELRCSSSDLIKLLKRCAPSLKVLELNHLELFPEKVVQSYSALHQGSERSHEAKPCLVNLFKQIKSILSLDKIRLSRYFRNSGRQEWCFSSDTTGDWSPDFWACANFPPHFHPPRGNSFPCILEQMYQWILGAEDCPVEILAIKEGDLDVTDEQIDAGHQLEDPSFFVSKHLIFDDASVISDASGASMPFLSAPGIDLSPPTYPFPPSDQQMVSGVIFQGVPRSPTSDQSDWSPMPPLEDIPAGELEYQLPH